MPEAITLLSDPAIQGVIIGLAALIFYALFRWWLRKFIDTDRPDMKTVAIVIVSLIGGALIVVGLLIYLFVKNGPLVK